MKPTDCPEKVINPPHVISLIKGLPPFYYFFITTFYFYFLNLDGKLSAHMPLVKDFKSVIYALKK